MTHSRFLLSRRDLRDESIRHLRRPLRDGWNLLDTPRLEAARPLVAIHAHTIEMPGAHPRFHSRRAAGHAEERLHRGVVALRDHQLDHLIESPPLLLRPPLRDRAYARHDVVRRDLDFIVEIQLPFRSHCENCDRDRQLADTRQREPIVAVQADALASIEAQGSGADDTIALRGDPAPIRHYVFHHCPAKTRAGQSETCPSRKDHPTILRGH